MKNPTPTEIGEEIIKASGINIYDASRKRDVIEFRSLFCYLLRNRLNMKWISIAAFLRSKGKPFDHATVMHSVKMYPIYKGYNNHLKEIERFFTFSNNYNYDDVDRVSYIEIRYIALEEKYENLKLKYRLLENKELIED